MNYREAKREVCALASSVLERCEPEDFADRPAPDHKRLSKAWDALIQELYERGVGRGTRVV